MQKIFNGISASPNQAQGRVHWIHNENDVEDFQVGEILFAKMTSPDWGEIFQKAAAVATEQGGMLCHAAIVAREEGIPAVVGIGTELGIVSNGTVVLVDGDEGIVKILEDNK